MNKIAEVSFVRDCRLTVYYDRSREQNRYRVYREWYESGNAGLRKRKMLLVSYADLLSAVTLIRDYAVHHNEEERL